MNKSKKIHPTPQQNKLFVLSQQPFSHSGLFQKDSLLSNGSALVAYLSIHIRHHGTNTKAKKTCCRLPHGEGLYQGCPK